MAQVNATQVRDGIAWATDHEASPEEPSDNPWVWFWQAIQGDFNENRSGKQIMTDAAISMIPGIDQICDARDLVADCRKLHKDVTDKWAWVALALTLIGLFPCLGSLVKGVLKLFFVFVRRAGGEHGVRAVEAAMTWVVTFLRRRDVQKYLHLKEIDEVFAWLAAEIKALRARINLAGVLQAFDEGIGVIQKLVSKVSFLPIVGKKAAAALDQLTKVRLKADEGLAQALESVFHAIDMIVLALEKKIMERQHGILNANNVHFRGALPEAAAVTMMRKHRPEWMGIGQPAKWPKADFDAEKSEVDKQVAKGYPRIDQQGIESFHRLMPVEIKGPARIYRIIAPNSRAMGDCWVSEEVYRKLKSMKNPRSAWRKYLAVWPDWNVNGQFVIYDVKRGETLLAWRGEAATQVRKGLDGCYLEGGFEQLVVKLDRKDVRNDTMRYYQLRGGKENRLQGAIDQMQYEMLSSEQKRAYIGIREKINHPSISGPFETGWGYTEFDGEGFVDKVGLPSLPGQVTNGKEL